MTRDLEDTAYHEAGHAVAAVAFRRPFHYVTIEPCEESLGHVMFRKFKASFNPELNSDLRTRVICENNAIISLVGPTAAAHFRRREKWLGADQDGQKATNIMSYLCRGGEELRAYMDLIGVWSKNFVRDEVHWAQIEAAAHMLVANLKGNGAFHPNRCARFAASLRKI